MSLIEDVAASYRILADQGIIDAYGHVSARSEARPDRYFLARSLAPESVTEGDIQEYDLDSNPIDPDARDSVLERFIHGEIYKARPDVMAIVHNHSPTVVPFSITTVPLVPIYHMAAFIGLGVPNWEIRDIRDGTDLLVRDAELGSSLAGGLGDKPAALMRGHGAVVVGESLARAVGRSVYLEVSARMQAQAMAIAGPGVPIATLNAAEVEAAVVRQDYYRAWPLWRAKALASMRA